MTNTHPNLSTKVGSLAYALNQNSAIINDMIANPNQSVSSMKEYISNIVIKINNKESKSPATRRFLAALAKQKDKVSVSMLVYNTILAGDNLAVC